MNDNGHILVVDDQREICDLVQEYLSGEGYRVSTAQDGGGMRKVMAQAPVDGISGLEMGGDAYLPNPFHLREWRAGVKAVLRRASTRNSETPGAPSRSRAKFAGWNLDLSSRELFSPAGKEVRLTTGEFDLLAAFVNNANQVLTRDRLLDLARNREAGPFDRTIDVQIGRASCRERV